MFILPIEWFKYVWNARKKFTLILLDETANNRLFSAFWTFSQHKQVKWSSLFIEPFHTRRLWERTEWVALLEFSNKIIFIKKYVSCEFPFICECSHTIIRVIMVFFNYVHNNVKNSKLSNACLGKNNVLKWITQLKQYLQ